MSIIRCVKVRHRRLESIGLWGNQVSFHSKIFVSLKTKRQRLNKCQKEKFSLKATIKVSFFTLTPFVKYRDRYVNVIDKCDSFF